MVLEKEINVLGVWDYIVFAAMLLVSAAIGIYYALSGGKQKTTDEFLLANRDMAVLPVAISILLSFISAIMVLGYPAEMYNEGTQFYIRVMASIGIVFGAIVFVPLFYPLKVTSSFEVSCFPLTKVRYSLLRGVC